MPIVNKSKNSYFPKLCLEYLNYPGTYVDEDIKRCFSNEGKLRNLQNRFSKRYNPKTRKFDPVIINWEELVHYLHVEEDLYDWQIMGMSGCEKCKVTYNDHTYNMYFLDGYSQYKSCYGGDKFDTQCFANDLWINVFVASIDGGICCHIDKKTSEIKFYGIGEDDGFWFIVNELWIQDIPMLKRYLMSEISEIKIEGLDHQKVIENIWNSDISVETKYRH